MKTPKCRHFSGAMQLGKYELKISQWNPFFFCSSPVTEMRGDNWQKAVQGYITATAGGSARSLCSWKLSSHLSKLPPNPPLSNLAVILSFLPSLSPSLPHCHLSLRPSFFFLLFFFLPRESAKRVQRGEHEGKSTNMVKIKGRHLKGGYSGWPLLSSPLSSSAHWSPVKSA